MHNNTSTLERLGGTTHYHYSTLESMENRHEFSLGFTMTFNMMQDVLFVLTRHSSQNAKLPPVAWHIHVSPYNN
jgi:hypothetical protein